MEKNFQHAKRIQFELCANSSIIRMLLQNKNASD